MWLIFAVLSVLPELPFDGKLTPELTSQLAVLEQSDKVYVVVHMLQEYPYHDVENLQIHEKIQTFREIARNSQQPCIEYLSLFPKKIEIVRQFWVFNGFHMRAIKDIIEEVALRNDVWYISHNVQIRIPPLERGRELSSRGIEWNVKKVQADSCWSAGFTGEGIVIGHIDTGVYPDHEALIGKWTGYWFDGIHGKPEPYDDHNHGTHTLGTILGGDGFGPFDSDIGVAPGAQYVCAKGFTAQGWGTYESLDPCFEFMAELKELVDIRAVSNSWGDDSTTALDFWQQCETWKSLGIFPVFANGNSGPGVGSACTPGNYPLVIGIGATDHNDNIASFSSRGPAPDYDPWNDPAHWYRPDWDLIKPDISAPGVNVRSATKNGGYASYQGTSMATPHVCGAVALLCQKNRAITPEELYNLITNNPDEPAQGAPYPNNTYGWGRLNIYKALQATPEMDIPYLILIAYELSDPAPGGNGNGQFEPRETVNLVTTIQNIGGADGYDVSGILYSDDNFITVHDDSSFFGNICLNDSASNVSDPYVISAHRLTPQGHTAIIKLIVSAQGDNGMFCDTCGFTIQIGTPPLPSLIFEDDFEYKAGIDSFLDYWTVSDHWTRSTEKYHSPPYSLYNGNVIGDSGWVQLKQNIDLRPFDNPQLVFWHTHKIFPSLFCLAHVEVTNNNGEKWHKVWQYIWYLGGSIPWTEETLSLCSYKGKEFNVRFRFYTITGAQNAQWFIDDFKILAHTDNEPPQFKNTTAWLDTTFSNPFGLPLHIQSEITDAIGVDSAYLYYRVNAGRWQKIPMSQQEDDIYHAVLPAQHVGNTVDYFLWARDEWHWNRPNSGTDPVGAPRDGYYIFNVTDLNIEEGFTQPVRFMMMTSNPTRDMVDISFTIPQEMLVTIVLYDVLGRRVKTLLSKKTHPGTYSVHWDRKDDKQREVSAGIYFLQFSAGDCETIEKVVLLK
ncbi:hypothetical protein AMJ52_01475 [candidate division TA06 bacterium DG_78]|uniref:Peptidase S8/S53 domain-containing protein n=1 Tax=candidate division TA06 bacterium DG_78 TaxID=1703772 RepID=A0A0S7YHJ0_UNCT6|nr:MAG: hypothetical protein AMJ52_01475 [candidate division TA06 bacterium DG_78]